MWLLRLGAPNDATIPWPIHANGWLEIHQAIKDKHQCRYLYTQYIYYTPYMDPVGIWSTNNLHVFTANVHLVFRRIGGDLLGFIDAGTKYSAQFRSNGDQKRTPKTPMAKRKQFAKKGFGIYSESILCNQNWFGYSLSILEIRRYARARTHTYIFAHRRVVFDDYDPNFTLKKKHCHILLDRWIKKGLGPTHV